MINGFRTGTTPMICGGEPISHKPDSEKPSIFKAPDFPGGNPRVRLPKEAPRYPENKHTMPCAADAPAHAAAAAAAARFFSAAWLRRPHAAKGSGRPGSTSSPIALLREASSSSGVRTRPLPAQ